MEHTARKHIERFKMQGHFNASLEFKAGALRTLSEYQQKRSTQSQQ